MRVAFVVVGLLGTVSIGLAQQKAVPADEVPPRYGYPYRPRAYPQETTKKALGSVIMAAERGDTNYLVAHLLDPSFVDSRIAERFRQFEPVVMDELTRLREYQRNHPDDTPSSARLPDELPKFQARVAEEARVRAFSQLSRDVREKLVDDPEVLKDLRRFYRSGTFPEAGDNSAKVGLPDVKDRAVFLKKIGDRWYIENRQTEDKVPEAKKE